MIFFLKTQIENRCNAFRSFWPKMATSLGLFYIFSGTKKSEYISCFSLFDVQLGCAQK
jgi:hypothetical protein